MAFFTANPRSPANSENDKGEIFGGGGRSPVTHVTTVSVQVTTVQSMPLTLTYTVCRSGDAPKPLPLMVSVVPPRELPTDGSTDSMTGVVTAVYWKVDDREDEVVGDDVSMEDSGATDTVTGQLPFSHNG